MKKTVALFEVKQAHQAIMYIWSLAKPLIASGKRLQLIIKPETRRDNHNRHFHSLIGQISEQLKGPLADPEDAKRILISAFKIDTKDDPDFAHEWAKFGDIRQAYGLRGEVVLLGTQSREFSVALAKAFIEWLYAFGAEMGVKFKAFDSEVVP